MPDQLRADVLSCYASRHAIAPNLDRLASQSFIFDQAYVTQPICAPARSSLLTGAWPHTTGCTNNESVLDKRFLCLPEMLADPDYCWGYMGKWHLGDELFQQHGFQEWISIMDGPDETKPSPGRDPNAISDYSKFLTARDYSLTRNGRVDISAAVTRPVFQPIFPSRSSSSWRPAISWSDIVGIHLSFSSLSLSLIRPTPDH
jgi:arylsulfatase A-like enzyme